MNVLTQVPMRHADVLAQEMDESQRRMKLAQDGAHEDEMDEALLEVAAAAKELAGIEEHMVLEHELDGKVKVLRRRKKEAVESKPEEKKGPRAKVSATRRITRQKAIPRPDFSTYLRQKRMQQQQRLQEKWKPDDGAQDRSSAGIFRIRSPHVHRVGLTAGSTSLADSLVADGRDGRWGRGTSVALPSV